MHAESRVNCSLLLPQTMFLEQGKGSDGVEHVICRADIPRLMCVGMFKQQSQDHLGCSPNQAWSSGFVGYSSSQLARLLPPFLSDLCHCSARLASWLAGSGVVFLLN